MSLRCPACDGDSRTLKAERVPGYKVLVCSRCGLVYTDPLVSGGTDEVGINESSATDEGYYKNIIAHHEEQVSLAQGKVKRLLEAYQEEFGLSPKRVLEFGCGTGQYATSWAALGVSWQGVEASPRMLEFCRHNALPVVDAESVQNLPDKSYDLIYFSQVLEHVLDPRGFLAQVRRLISDGGIVHLDVPNHDSLSARIRRWNPRATEYGFIQAPHHLIAYRALSLKRLIEACGFSVVRIGAFPNDHEVFGQLLVRPSLAHRLLMKVDRVIGSGALLVCVARPR